MGPSGRPRRRTRITRKARTKSELMKRKSTSTTRTSTTTAAALKIDDQESGGDEVVAVNSPSKSSCNDEEYGFPKTEGIEFEAVDDVVSSPSGCSTPKGQRFRIPEIRTCPPAPKKQRVISNCSIQRTPIAFFAPPDLELFFYCALRGISV